MRHFSVYAFAGRTGVLRWSKKTDVSYLSFCAHFFIHILLNYIRTCNKFGGQIDRIFSSFSSRMLKLTPQMHHN